MVTRGELWRREEKKSDAQVQTNLIKPRRYLHCCRCSLRRQLLDGVQPHQAPPHIYIRWYLKDVDGIECCLSVPPSFLCSFHQNPTNKTQNTKRARPNQNQHNTGRLENERVH